MTPLQRLSYLSVAGLCLSAALAAPFRPTTSSTEIVLGDGSSAAFAATQQQLQQQQQQVVIQQLPTSKKRGLQGRFLHITDLHPDEFYKTHSSTEESDACHRGKGPAGTYGAETSDCDSPYSLINATFAWIAENLAEQVDFVVWTGDSARHDSDEDIPRSESQVLGANQRIADKFVEVFGDVRNGGNGLAIPVIPTFGNNDILPHNILAPGPNRWLSAYANIWRPFIPEEQRHSFEFGGWFYVEVIPNRLAVISLNTMYFFDRNAAVDDCVHPSEPGFKQMEWLRVQLQVMRERSMKAILTGHVPPARTDSKQLWDETCWQKYTLWLQQYRDVVTGSLYGHMNIDHFLLQDSEEIDIGLLGAVADGDEIISLRGNFEDEMSVASTADYLQELRSSWASLPKPVLWATEKGDVNIDLRKKKHNKKPKKKTPDWGERFQVSLVGPSIVPNYFPTLRVMQYNITGLEDTNTWADWNGTPPVESESSGDVDESYSGLELRRESDADFSADKNKKKKHKKKPKKPKTPKDPYLVIPTPPAKTAAPGPAYSPQPFTFTGFTQYYANLTRINHDFKTSTPTSSAIDATKWRKGKHGDKVPESRPAKPEKFEFQVEYSTFDDKIYRVKDLTVSSWLQLAYRMGQGVKSKGMSLGKLQGDELVQSTVKDVNEDDEDDEATIDDVGLDIEDNGEDAETAGKKKKNKGGHGKKDKDKKKKKKKHDKKKQTKVWLHFLKHAYISTVDEKDLRDI